LKFEGGLVNFTPLKNTLAVKGLKKSLMPPLPKITMSLKVRICKYQIKKVKNCTHFSFPIHFGNDRKPVQWFSIKFQGHLSFENM